MTIDIKKVDYHNAQQMADLITILDSYAQDPMGGGESLSPETKKHLASELQKRSFMTSLIAYVDGKPVGLANCIESFSTFACKPILNIHDMAVIGDFRGLGLSQQLLNAVEELAREKGCSKVTLEVLSGNKVAMNAYEKFGFTGYELDPAMGKAEFWEKKLK
ncbi:GNAT family N-acetyltransferase [Thalassotalea euphylliae]|uniref:GNAT family N-acetyltransferase n=1 Tax=Thalassotalea euphylliae TaxID=1655234 RepID=A0A3E0TRV0_9GAMM|nr:GNAT family N-acetyltransferase [Thalassotalea euphylliae]REL27214.1 GNAT family N-acetyltransferase [Thalassotalea euphylliae]